MTNPADSGTNAAAAVTAPRLSWRVPLAFASAWVLVNAAINSASVASDLARRGVRFSAAEPWIWELSSALAILALVLPVVWLDARLRVRLPGVWGRAAAYLGLSVAFSAAHVLSMVGLRIVAYRLAGWHYEFGPWPEGALYEYRKDAATLAAIVVVAALWRRWLARGAHERAVDPVALPAGAPAPPPAGAPPVFVVRTATQGDLLVRADEIDWIEAQGNYVGLHVGGDVRLLRATLAEMEAKLRAHAFIRTHRRALVNRQRVRALTPPDAALAGVRLASGELAPLSESRRAEVLRDVIGA